MSIDGFRVLVKQKAAPGFMGDGEGGSYLYPSHTYKTKPRPQTDQMISLPPIGRCGVGMESVWSQFGVGLELV